MRRLLTGYAVSFNRRHRRWGHLFQNRYKSILCQEETYLLELKYKVRAQGYDVERIARRVGQLMQMHVTQVTAPGKNRQTVGARGLLCYWAVRECGMTMVSLSRKLGISSTAVSQSVVRGEKIAFENNFKLMSD